MKTLLKGIDGFGSVIRRAGNDSDGDKVVRWRRLSPSDRMEG